MPRTLLWTTATTLPVEAETLRPDVLCALSALEASRRTIAVGNTSAELGELAKVEGDGSDGHLVVEGDLRHVRRIGEGMAAGRLTIRGDVGHHLGAGMAGGIIEVVGAVGDWAGAEMRGGTLRVRGNVGDGLGAAYPGSRRGMRDGLILVEGTVGDEAGLAMRRGLIAVSGRVGDGLGRAMVAGSIVVFGAVGLRPGAGMKRGSLVLSGADAVTLLPSFRASGRWRPPFLTLYLRSLAERGFPVPEAAFAATWRRYNGDLVEQGQGEIWLGTDPWMSERTAS